MNGQASSTLSTRYALRALRAADRPLPFGTGRIRLNAPYFSHFVVQRSGLTIVPCREILGLIASRGYNGFVCAEWEKKWHPEIEEPEIALPQHARVLHEWMAGEGDRG